MALVRLPNRWEWLRPTAWVRRSWHSAEPAPGVYRALTVSPEDEEGYRAFRERSAVWRQGEERLSQGAPQVVYLLEDLYHAFCSESARLNPDAHPACHWNFTIIANLLISPGYRRLRSQTAGDPLAGALAALRLAEEAVAELTRSQELRQLLVKAWQVRHSSRRALALKLQVDAAYQGAVVYRTLSNILTRASRRLELDATVRAAWGIHPGQRSLHAFDDVASLLDMARTLPGIEQLTEALVSFQRLLHPGRRRRPTGVVGRQRITGVTQGHRLDAVVEEELVKLTDPDLEDLFREAYEHRRLLQHAYTGESHRPRGTIACCIDVSRSMNTPAALGRERFLWAKALALALLDLARREDRPFVGICFSSQKEMAVFPVARGSYRPDVALEMARCDFNGGTHFEAPLTYALDALKEGGKGAEPYGDIVFLTDGEAPLSTAFAERFRRIKGESGTRLFSVFIDQRNEPLQSLSDRSFFIRSRHVGSWERAVLQVGSFVRT